MQYLVVDLEATCWEDQQHQREKQETIEIGAVRLQSSQGPIESSFGRFVKPMRYPQLSAFCTQLTTITQADVDGAESFPLVWRAFVEWAGEQPWVFCSWGNYDIRQLYLDCQQYGLAWPNWPLFINIKTAFANHYQVRPMGMTSALKQLNLPLQGTHHRGLDDAYNIARIALTFLHEIEPGAAQPPPLYSA